MSNFLDLQPQPADHKCCHEGSQCKAWRLLCPKSKSACTSHACCSYRRHSWRMATSLMMTQYSCAAHETCSDDTQCRAWATPLWQRLWQSASEAEVWTAGQGWVLGTPGQLQDAMGHCLKSPCFQRCWPSSLQVSPCEGCYVLQTSMCNTEVTAHNTVYHPKSGLSKAGH